MAWGPGRTMKREGVGGAYMRVQVPPQHRALSVSRGTGAVTGWGLVRASFEGVGAGAGGGVCVPKMAQTDIPDCKFWFFPTMVPWVWGGGVGTRPQYRIVCLWRRPSASHHCSF